MSPVFALPEGVLFLLAAWGIWRGRASAAWRMAADYVVVNSPVGSRWGGEVQRRNLIVFRSPLDPRQICAKRAVGVPGDRLRLVGKMLQAERPAG
jgi:hypothetical protein